MSLLKTINNATPRVNEDAASGSVGSGGVAAMATPLFASMVKRSIPTVTTSKDKKKSKKKKGLGLQEAFDNMGGMGDMGMQGQVDPSAGSPRASSKPSFDASGVVSKLKGLENKEKQDFRDTVSFGLEDDNGGLVRVSVRSEQAQDFEKALQSFMADEDDGLEIAEVLFKLRDQFDIVDVQWPDVEEDEEEDMALAGQEGEMPPEGEMSPEGGEDLLGGEMGAPAGEEQAVSVLTQVIDMMKADAEARKAEARAREAEAKTKEAESIVNQVSAKVKQEEQFLDMDTYNKAKKDEEREAKRLAQLAKWKHDMAREQGVTDDDEYGGSDMGGMSEPPMQQQQPAAPEEEEYTMRRPAPVAKQQPRKAASAVRIRPQEVADFILNRVKK